MEVESVGHTVVVVVHGEADILTAPCLAQGLAPVVAGTPERLVLDLADLGFLDCAAARVIAKARRGLPVGTCQIVLRRPRPVVRRVLEIMGLDGPCLIEQ